MTGDGELVCKCSAVGDSHNSVADGERCDAGAYLRDHPRKFAAGIIGQRGLYLVQTLDHQAVDKAHACCAYIDQDLVGKWNWRFDFNTLKVLWWSECPAANDVHGSVLKGCSSGQSVKHVTLANSVADASEQYSALARPAASTPRIPRHGVPLSHS